MQYSVAGTREGIELTQTSREPSKNLVILCDAQKLHAARAAFAQALYYMQFIIFQTVHSVPRGMPLCGLGFQKSCLLTGSAGQCSILTLHCLPSNLGLSEVGLILTSDQNKEQSMTCL
jgi:hypothetical protein